MPGFTHTPISGAFTCGDGTRVGTWTVGATEAPDLILTPRTVVVGWVPDGVTGIIVGRPRLILKARAFQTGLSSQIAPGRAVLELRGKAFEISPVATLSFGRPRLALVRTPFVLGLSNTLIFGRPQLLLLGREIERVGRPGLLPTVPATRILVPTAPGSRTLVPTVPRSGDLLVPTEERVR